MVKRVKVTGGELYADVDGEGPAVVLVHSGVTDGRQWEAVAELVKPRRTVIRYDRRGFGRSAEVERGRYCAALDLLELLDGLGLERVVACGNSAGGEAVLEAAALQPERFARLLLLAPALHPWEFSERVRTYSEAEEAALAAGDIDRAIELNLDMWVYRQEHRGPVAAMLRTSFENQRRRPFEEFGLEDPLVAERLDRITCPVRIMVGEHDVDDFRAIARYLADRLADATAEDIADAGHLLGMEVPDLVASAL